MYERGKTIKFSGEYPYNLRVGKILSYKIQQIQTIKEKVD